MSIITKAGRRVPVLLRMFGLYLCIAMLGGAVSKAQIAVTYPVGGERCVAGSDEKIEWTTATEGNVDIFLWDGREGVWSTIATNISASQGYYWWTAPEELRGEMFRVKVESVTGAGYGLSSTYFYVVEAEPFGAQKGIGAEGSGSVGSTLSILPNPISSGVARLSYNGEEPLRLTLRDMLGNVVKELAPGSGSATISTAGLADGVYMVEATYPGGIREAVKLVVRR